MIFGKRNKQKKSTFRKIVNGFLYVGIGIIIAFLILFGISQTSTFRDWLKDKLVTTINGSINGNLSINRIDGTIFTSVILNNTLLLQERDTLFFAEEIELRTSPLKLLFKTIHLRTFKISNAKISFLKDEQGKLNISKISKPSGEIIEQDTTTSNGFNYAILIADLSLNNVDFKIQSFDKRQSNEVYDNINGDDLRVDDINLSLNALVNFNSEEIGLNIKNFSCKPNLKGFQLKSLSGNFVVEGNNVGLRGMKILTERSNILVNAEMRNIPLWDDGEIRIEELPLRLDLDGEDFNFDDLTNFIPATGLLNGSLKTRISARGTLNNLSLLNLDISFSNTRLRGQGNLRNVVKGGEMNIDMSFHDTYIHPEDPNNLLRDIDIPVYNQVGVLRFDTLYFQGEPLKFNAGMDVSTEKGDFDGVVILDLTEKDMGYDITLFTQYLDLSPVLNLPTSLNSHLKLTGKGTSPDSMNASVSFTANWSEIKSIKYKNLKLNLTANDGDINYNLSFKADTSSGTISGGINFSNLDKPYYDIDATLHNFNIADFSTTSGMETNLNMNVLADGNSFDQDNLEIFAIIDIDSSNIDEIQLDNKKIIVDLRNDPDGSRVINVVSNLADITLTGKFSVLDIATIIEAESNLITDFIDHNMYKISPVTGFDPETINAEYILPDESVNINYSIEFKDFQILSLFLGEADLEVDGDINGMINRKGDLLSLSLDMDVNYFQLLKMGKLYFTSGFKFNAVLSNDFSIPFPQSFRSDLNLSIRELYLANKLRNIKLEMSVDDKLIRLNYKGKFDDYALAEFSGDIKLLDNSISLVLDSLYLKCYDYDLRNVNDVDILYSDNRFYINNFVMSHHPSKIELSGNYSLIDDHNLTLKIENLKGKELSNKILYLPREAIVSSNINLSAYWQGTAQSPLLNMNLTADNIKIRNKRLGSLLTTGSYSSGVLRFDVDVLDTLYDMENPILSANGLVPVNLSIGSQELNNEASDFKLSFYSQDFDLTMIGGAITQLRELQGKLSAQVEISGDPDNPNYSGFADLNNVSSILLANNIMYNAHGKAILDNENIYIDSVYIRNVPGILGGGTLYGSGTISHNNLSIEKIIFHANGTLKTLTKETRAVSPTIFGDLAIQTTGDLVYIFEDGSSTFDADLLIKDGADITISTGHSVFTNTSDKLIYRHKEYYDAFGGRSIIDSLISVSNQQLNRFNKGRIERENLNLRVKISVEDDAKMVLELAPEFDQNLTAYLGGEIQYNLNNDITSVQGAFNLLEGSRLQFIKPLDARGTISFFEELDNPYLDVMATYRAYYEGASDTTVAGTEKEVEIRIRLEGPLKELQENFRNQKNIEVYVRENQLADFQLDATRTSSDALMFIITGVFTDDATPQQRTFVASMITSLAGSLLGTLLNDIAGDLIQSVRLQTIGTETKFSLFGKIGILRYEIGGTSRVFQDFSRANLKIELPTPNLRNLIWRVQRRDPFLGTAAYGEMINEFGVKYTFDF